MPHAECKLYSSESGTYWSSQKLEKSQYYSIILHSAAVISFNNWPTPKPQSPTPKHSTDGVTCSAFSHSELTVKLGAERERPGVLDAKEVVSTPGAGKRSPTIIQDSVKQLAVSTFVYKLVDCTKVWSLHTELTLGNAVLVDGVGIELVARHLVILSITAQNGEQSSTLT